MWFCQFCHQWINPDVFIQQEIARHRRPATLRALYGKDKVKNSVHCTDLPEDGVLEVGGISPTHAHCTTEYTHCVVPLNIGFLIVVQAMHK